MKKIYTVVFLLLSLYGFGQDSATEVLSYFNQCNDPDSTDGGIVIKTNLPFGTERYMPTIVIEGYNYHQSKSIGLIINYYVYNSGSGEYFFTRSVSSHGAYTPNTYLFNDNGKVSIFLEKTGGQYCVNFSIRSWLRTESDGGATAAWFQGWTASVLEDGPPVATNNYVKLQYENATERMKVTELYNPVGKYIHFGSQNREFFAGTNAGTSPNSSANYNIGIGTNSSYSMTTGGHNIGLGHSSLASNSTGNYNVASGYAALTSNTTGHGNVGIGYAALNKNTSGSYNIALNYASLNRNQTGSHNIALGFAALYESETGSHNIALGANAFRSNKTGISNVFIGNGVAYHGNGNYSVGLGQSALFGYKNISSNVVIGFSAAYKAGDVDSLSQVSASTLIGYASGYNDANQNRSIVNSVMIGHNSGRTSNALAKSINNSIGVGFQSLYGSEYDFTGGIAIGYDAGRFIDANLSNVTLIGREAGTGLTANNVLVLGGSGSYKQNVLIGKSEDTGDRLQVESSASFSNSLTGVKISNDATEGGRAILILDKNSSNGIGQGSDYMFLAQSVSGGSSVNSSYGNLKLRTFGVSDVTITPNNTFHTVFKADGSIGIGTPTIPSGYKLAIAGKVITEKVVVRNSGNWPDFVFAKNYKLPELSEVEEFINSNNHLPEIPSAKEIEANGQDLGEMNRLLLKKVEELTLYLIEQQVKLKDYESRLDKLENDK